MLFSAKKLKRTYTTHQMLAFTKLSFGSASSKGRNDVNRVQLPKNPVLSGINVLRLQLSNIPLHSLSEWCT